MKRIFYIAVAAFLFPTVCFAVNWQRLDMETRPVSAGDKIRVFYVTGYPDIDQTTPCFMYSVWFEFEDGDAVLKRNMIDQKKGKGVEEVEIFRIKYADIKDLLYGYDAIYAAQEGQLTTAQTMICNGQRLTTLMQVGGAPLAIMFLKDKKMTSLVVRASDAEALRLYRALAERAKIKPRTPLTYKGIVKVRDQLIPPPPESER